MRRLALAATVAVASLGLALTGAAPATAAELPEDNDLWALDEETFYSLATTGALASISALPPVGGKYGADYDPTSGLGYFFTDDNAGVCTLYTVDLDTGDWHEIGVLEGAPDFDECDALDVSWDGTLRIADQDGRVLTVDKATGATISSVLSNNTYMSFLTTAADGTMYTGDYDGGLYTFDPVTGVATPLPASPFDYIETASIDGAGTLWISSWGDGCQSLWSVNVSDPMGTVQFQGDFLDGEDCGDIFALFVSWPQGAPPAKLAATGAEPAWILGPFALLLLLGGAAALTVRRVRAA